MYMYWNPASALTTESLDGYLPNLLGIKYSWPPPRPICIDFWAKSTKGRIQGMSMIGQWGALLHRQWSKSNWEDMLIFLALSFWHILVSCIGLSHFHLLPFKYIYGAKCLIFIHVCTFHVKENSARLQWYSCARYKAPWSLVVLSHFCEF